MVCNNEIIVTYCLWKIINVSVNKNIVMFLKKRNVSSRGRNEMKKRKEGQEIVNIQKQHRISGFLTTQIINFKL